LRFGAVCSPDRAGLKSEISSAASTRLKAGASPAVRLALALDDDVLLCCMAE
jgi:hypothetical protein